VICVSSTSQSDSLTPGMLGFSAMTISSRKPFSVSVNTRFQMPFSAMIWLPETWPSGIVR
jgi:hypothetical protein